MNRVPLFFVFFNTECISDSQELSFFFSLSRSPLLITISLAQETRQSDCDTRVACTPSKNDKPCLCSISMFLLNVFG